MWNIGSQAVTIENRELPLRVSATDLSGLYLNVDIRLEQVKKVSKAIL
jgi:hypothetical protein